MRRTFRYRLYPTKAQAAQLDRQLGLCRELYNAAVQERRDAWRINHVSIGFNAQSAQLPEIKVERPEVEGVYSQVLQDVLHRVDKNFKAFFTRVKQGLKAGFPRFRSAARYDSLTYPQLGFVVDARGTSQTCLCGASVPKTLSQRWHLCDKCGLSAPRDYVSAQLVLGRGLRLQASTWPTAACVA